MSNIIVKIKNLFGSAFNNTKYIESENKRLELAIKQLSNQSENYKVQFLAIQNEKHKLESALKQFCGNMLGNMHAMNQLGGSNVTQMNVYEFMSYTENIVRQEQGRIKTLLAELTLKLNERDKDVEGLQVQLTQMMAKMKHQGGQELSFDTYPDSSNEQTTNETPSEQKPDEKVTFHQVADTDTEGLSETDNATNDAADDTKNNTSKAVKNGLVVTKAVIVETSNDIDEKNNDENSKNYLKNAQSSTIIAETTEVTPINDNYDGDDSEKVVPHLIDLNTIVSQMDNVAWTILEAIGKKGHITKESIQDYIFNESILKGTVKNGTFNNAIALITSLNIVEREKISTHKWYHIYSFTDIGMRIFKSKFGTEPVETEKDVLQREHQNYVHGFYIRDTAQVLLENSKFNYISASTNRKENTIDLHNGKSYIPDIIARKADGSVDYYEIELGNHSQGDFNEKCDKIRSLSKHLYFITDTDKTASFIFDKQILAWAIERGGKERLKGTHIHVTSCRKLQDAEPNLTWSYYKQF